MSGGQSGGSLADGGDPARRQQAARKHQPYRERNFRSHQGKAKRHFQNLSAVCFLFYWGGVMMFSYTLPTFIERRNYPYLWNFKHSIWPFLDLEV